jgi:hypothetical protein
MKNLCKKCEKKGKCFFEKNYLVCKKLVEQERSKNGKQS